MILGIFAIHDKVAKNFGSITVDLNAMTAKRNFSYAVNNDKQLAYIAKDMELVQIGTMDSESGQIIGITPCEVICGASEVMTDD